MIKVVKNCKNFTYRYNKIILGCAVSVIVSSLENEIFASPRATKGRALLIEIVE